MAAGAALTASVATGEPLSERELARRFGIPGRGQRSSPGGERHRRLMNAERLAGSLRSGEAGSLSDRHSNTFGGLLPGRRTAQPVEFRMVVLDGPECPLACLPLLDLALDTPLAGT